MVITMVSPVAFTTFWFRATDESSTYFVDRTATIHVRQVSTRWEAASESTTKSTCALADATRRGRLSEFWATARRRQVIEIGAGAA